MIFYYIVYGIWHEARKVYQPPNHQLVVELLDEVHENAELMLDVGNTMQSCLRSPRPR